MECRKYAFYVLEMNLPFPLLTWNENRSLHTFLLLLFKFPSSENRSTPRKKIYWAANFSNLIEFLKTSPQMKNGKTAVERTANEAPYDRSQALDSFHIFQQIQVGSNFHKILISFFHISSSSLRRFAKVSSRFGNLGWERNENRCRKKTNSLGHEIVKNLCWQLLKHVEDKIVFVLVCWSAR